MLDPSIFKTDIEALAARLADRGYTLDISHYNNLEAQRKSLQEETESLQATRNRTSKEIGAAKSRGEDVRPLLDSVADLGDRLKDCQSRLGSIQSELFSLFSGIPNLAHESVPVGSDETQNEEVAHWGNPRVFDFEIQDHVDLGEKLGMMDYDTASRLSGSRFVVLKGALARMHRALAQFMINLHVDRHGYTEANVPMLVNSQTLYGTGQLPKFEEDQFATRDESPYYLIPTAEVPLTNLVGDQILDVESLTMRLML